MEDWETFDEIPKAEFDYLAKSDSFTQGPFIDNFGDGPGEPYIPNRQAFGILKSGRKVRSWVRGSNPKSSYPEVRTPSVSEHDYSI